MALYAGHGSDGRHPLARWFAGPADLLCLNDSRRCSEAGWAGYFLDGTTKIPADQVLDEALEFWIHFIRDNGIAQDAITDAVNDTSTDAA